jgi:1-acyl-sn-glycerol-3-phosphate acyltransferase
LALSLAEVLVRFAWLWLRSGPEIGLSARAHWLHEACALIVRRLGLEEHSSGPIPEHGLVVSNHLSYLDILLFASVMPCVFVAKSDVRRWPVFGLLAHCGGTIFVKRERSTSLTGASQRIEETMAAGIPVLLFPEGTSSDGSTVLRFHPSLLEPAVRLAVDISVAAIRYAAEDCSERDLCYYGDITFGPHLLEVLGRRGTRGMIRFGMESAVYSDRKVAARDCWERVMMLRSRAESSLL